MMMADGMFGAIAIVMVVGFFGFFFVVAMALFRVVGTLFRRLFMIGGGDDSARPVSFATRNVHCRNPQCRHTNIPTARYCARCGQRLAALEHVDQHG
ncbi:MAG: hypothetical protein JNG88_13615 [Phycisphaerales bacterium]|nr:hypothetical protein [Phycisphaerales bacterium]